MKIETRSMILVAMFAALTAVGAFIRIPTPIVPYTLQFLFCAYAGILLGAKDGLFSQLLYVGLGLLGIPVFANGGGPTYVLQPTFGYLIGFILCAFTIGRLTERLKKVTFPRVLGPVLVGLTLVYLCGLVYLYLIVNLYLRKSMSVEAVVAAGFLPYIVPDLILSIFVAGTAVYVVPALKRAGIMKAAER